MQNLQTIDYAAFLSGLKEKRSELMNTIAEIDDTILHIENLIKIGILQNKNTVSPTINANVVEYNNHKELSMANMTLYDAAIYLLEREGRTLKTDYIANEYIASGKEFTSPNPRLSIGPSLYKIAKEKKNCRLIRTGEGEWGLIDWQLNDIKTPNAA